jgi:hypothetical protein
MDVKANAGMLLVDASDHHISNSDKLDATKIDSNDDAHAGRGQNILDQEAARGKMADQTSE